jgi:hypothetical protein
VNRVIVVLLILIINLTTSLKQAQASIINGSFETGDLTGWTASPAGLVSVVSSYDTFTPVHGNFFALLEAGAGTGVYTTLSQTFSANAGDTILGWAFFQANDYMPYNDDAYVRIVQGNLILFSSSVSAVGDYGFTPWTFFAYTFPSSGTFTIEAGVRNVEDNALSSVLGLDYVRLVATPEPSSLAAFSLAVTAFAGYIGWRRRTARSTA